MRIYPKVVTPECFYRGSSHGSTISPEREIANAFNVIPVRPEHCRRVNGVQRNHLTLSLIEIELTPDGEEVPKAG